MNEEETKTCFEIKGFFRDYANKCKLMLFAYIMLLVFDITCIMIVDWSKLHGEIKIIAVAVEVVIIAIAVVYSIASAVRLYDANKIINSNLKLISKKVEVTLYKDNEVNKIYCDLYIKDKKKIEVGKTYKIKFIQNSLGKYIVESNEVRK